MTLALTNDLLYKHLGKLFYAIAISDTVIQDEEFEALQRCVQEYWKDYNHLNQVFTDDDPSHVIEAVFEGVEAFELDGYQMYADFVSYKRAHSQLFTNALNTLIMTTAQTIAHAFGNIDPSEKRLLVQLGKELSITS